MKSNIKLAVIVAAALLVELTTGVIYYSAQDIIHKTMERLVEREMNSIFLSIRNQLAKVEVTVDNMEWVVNESLSQPDTLFTITHRLVEYNPSIQGCGILFTPNYYPQKGRLFEPYSVRRPNGTITTQQIGSSSHDYTQMIFYTVPIAKNEKTWCDPYLDSIGSNKMVTTYSVPVHNQRDSIVAVVCIDISIDWLDDIIMAKTKLYKNTRRFLVTNSGTLLAGEDNQTFQAVLELLKADSDNEGYVKRTASDGEKQHVFFHPVGGKTDWVLIDVLNDKDVFGQLRQIRLLLAILVVTGMVLVGFIVYRSSRNLERLRQVDAEKAISIILA